MSERENAAHEPVESAAMIAAAPADRSAATTTSTADERENISAKPSDQGADGKSEAGGDSGAMNSSKRTYRFAALAASLVAAAVAGGLIGSLGTLAAKGAPPAVAQESRSAQELKKALAQVKSELTTLQASFDKANLPALRETVARLDKRMASPSSPDITGSITQASAPKEPPKPPIVRGWVLRDVARGRALVENGYDLYEVLPGAILPEVGRVESISRQNGRWVVVTAKGLIVSSR